IRSAEPPACSISRWQRSSSALLRTSRPTLAPLAANPIANRLPIPRPAPVTSTGTVLKDCTPLKLVQNERSGEREFQVRQVSRPNLSGPHQGRAAAKEAR